MKKSCCCFQICLSRKESLQVKKMALPFLLHVLIVDGYYIQGLVADKCDFSYSENVGFSRHFILCQCKNQPGGLSGPAIAQAM